ncbi:MAG: hypothetical protein Q7R87_01045 [Nanoarchaeota archaeon]|nr:hypothetical protein [Nanoarchaeota archaeon]
MKIRVHPRIEREHLRDIANIDRARFNLKNYPEASFEHVAKHPEMYTVLTHNDNVVGYGLVIPVNKFAHEALKRGEMDESELKSRHITIPDKCSGLYVASIAAAPNTGAILRSRLVGYTLGSVLRAPKEVFAIAVSQDGDNIAREIGMKDLEYLGPLKGINGFTPKLFVNNPFEYSNN